MAKSSVTKDLERQIWSATQKIGVSSCFEVTIGDSGRVDYMTVDSNDVWRCYEIKASVSDFRSKAKKTFIGHYNYFVLTQELYDTVKNEIPQGIGVFVGGCCVKAARRRDLGMDESILKDSMIRSLSRTANQVRASRDVDRMNSLRQECESFERRYRETNGKYHRLINAIYDKYGAEALHELEHGENLT